MPAFNLSTEEAGGQVDLCDFRTAKATDRGVAPLVGGLQEAMAKPCRKFDVVYFPYPARGREEGDQELRVTVNYRASPRLVWVGDIRKSYFTLCET